MRKVGFLAVLAASFVGVFGALELDRYAHKGDIDTYISTSGDLLPAVSASYSVPASPVTGDFRAAAKKVLPSVVSVDRLQRQVEGYFDEQPTETIRETGTGSGVVLTKDGLIVTNNHVVNGADSVRVRLSDKRSLMAKVIGTDPISDLAVIKVDANNLQPIELGDSSKVEVGQWVVAIGNPLGYDGTVSVGVVSSLGRSLVAGDGEEGQSVLVGAIQTDAAINPGNSGGALTDTNGELIGINSAIATPSRGSVGIGFAIPANRVRRIVNDITKLGYARYGSLGVSIDPRLDGILQIQSVRQQLSQRLGSTPPSNGIFIRTLDPAGALALAGVKSGDVLLEVEGDKVNESVDLRKDLSDKMPGDKVTVKYWTRGSVKTVSVKLGELRSQ